MMRFPSINHQTPTITVSISLYFPLTKAYHFFALTGNIPYGLSALAIAST